MYSAEMSWYTAHRHYCVSGSHCCPQSKMEMCVWHAPSCYHSRCCPSYCETDWRTAKCLRSTSCPTHRTPRPCLLVQLPRWFGHSSRGWSFSATSRSCLVQTSFQGTHQSDEQDRPSHHRSRLQQVAASARRHRLHGLFGSRAQCTHQCSVPGTTRSL